MSPLRALLAATAAAALAAAASIPARAADPVPDFELFKARVEPVLQTVCSQCHAGKGKGRFALIVHAPGAPFPDDEHRKNYETVLRLVVPGAPERSAFLQKPLANSADGEKHGGGDRIFSGSPTYRAWVDFIEGRPFDGMSTPAATATDRAAPATEVESVATLGDRELVLQAEALEVGGGAAPADAPGATGRVVAPGPQGGRLAGRFRVSRSATYAFSVRASGAGKTLAVRFDGGAPLSVDVAKDALAAVSARVPCDGGRPIEVSAGTASVVAGEARALRLEGAPARLLLPADVGHTRVEALVADLAPGAEAYVFFDAVDAANGKLFGLASGGTEVVLAVLEAGRTRVLARAPRPAGLPGERIAVEYVSGIAVGRLDGKPLVHVNFDRALGAGRFGFEAKGTLLLRDLVASDRGREVHRIRLSEDGRVSLDAGEHRVEVSLPPGGPAIDSISIVDTTVPTKSRRP